MAMAYPAGGTALIFPLAAEPARHSVSMQRSLSGNGSGIQVTTSERRLMRVKYCQSVKSLQQLHKALDFERHSLLLAYEVKYSECAASGLLGHAFISGRWSLHCRGPHFTRQ